MHLKHTTSGYSSLFIFRTYFFSTLESFSLKRTLSKHTTSGCFILQNKSEKYFSFTLKRILSTHLKRTSIPFFPFYESIFSRTPFNLERIHLKHTTLLDIPFFPFSEQDFNYYIINPLISNTTPFRRVWNIPILKTSWIFSSKVFTWIYSMHLPNIPPVVSSNLLHLPCIFFFRPRSNAHLKSTFR